MRRSVLKPLVHSDDERLQLERCARRPKSFQALALRYRIVLECAKGGHNVEVAERLGIDRGTANKWRARFSAQRLDEPRRERRAQLATTTRDRYRSRPSKRPRPTPRTGRRVPWLKRPG